MTNYLYHLWYNYCDKSAPFNKYTENTTAIDCVRCRLCGEEKAKEGQFSFTFYILFSIETTQDSSTEQNGQIHVTYGWLKLLFFFHLCRFFFRIFRSLLLLFCVECVFNVFFFSHQGDDLLFIFCMRGTKKRLYL